MKIICEAKGANVIKKRDTHANSQVFNALGPEFLRKTFDKFWERFLRSSQTDLRIPLLKTLIGQTLFSYIDTKQWNSLERELKLAP